MTFKKLLVASAIALSGSVALAGGVDYDYAQTGYVDYDSENGFNIELSKEFAENWYGRIDYTDVNDADAVRLNLGFKTALSNSTDFVAEAGYEDWSAGSYSESGYNALVGLRGMATDNLEFGAYAQYSEVIESTDLTVEGRYHFNDAFSVGVEIGNDDELEEHYGVNVRFSF